MNDNANAATWKQKICPLLSIASMKAPSETGKIMTADGMRKQPEGPRATGCQGGGCMLFIPSALTPDGKTVDGVCAATMIPVAINVLTQTMTAIAQAAGIKPTEAPSAEAQL